MNTDVEKDRNLDRRAPLETIYASLAENTKTLGALGINLHFSHLTARLLEVFHAAGLPVSVWTVNEPADVARVVPLAPDNITTRRPGLVLAALHDAKAAGSGSSHSSGGSLHFSVS